MANKEKPNRAEVLKHKALNHPLIAIGSIAVSSIVVFNTITGGPLHLAEEVGLWKPRQLRLTEESARGEFSRRLTELAYRRIFWANNYVGRIKRKAQAVDIDIAWNNYMNTVGDWSVTLVGNRLQLSEFYGSEKENEFNTVVDDGLKSIHASLITLRYPDSSPEDLDAVFQKIDKVNEDVYFFASGLREKKPDFLDDILSKQPNNGMQRTRRTASPYRELRERLAADARRWAAFVMFDETVSK